MDTLLLVGEVILGIAVTLGFFIMKSHVRKYLEEKGKNLATKEDNEEITRKIELVKADIAQRQTVFDARYKLKYEACLEALTIIDIFFSHALVSADSKRPVPQEADTSRARECHSKLIITCKSPALVEKFNEICFKNRTSDGFKTPPTDLLNDFRNLVREELAFGEDIPLDREATWFAVLSGDPNDPNQTGR